MAAEPAPRLTAAEADDTLRALRAEADRIADALDALDQHPGRVFLANAALRGATAAAWTDAKATIGQLHDRYQAYRGVLSEATAVRERRSRPGPAELAELTALLTGQAVTLSSEDIPLARRNLTGPATVTHRLSLGRLVTEMDTAFGEVTGLVTAVDEVRSAAVGMLDPLDRRLADARERAASLGLSEARHPLFTALVAAADELAEIQELAFADPLALHAGPLAAGTGGHADVSRARRVEAEVSRVEGELDALDRVRAGLADRLARAGAAVDGVAAEADAAHAARAVVLDKIAAPAIGDVPDAADALRGRLRDVTELSRRGRWPEVAAALTGLDGAVAAALAEVRAVRETADALLARRAELRGRLDAYKVKVARLRHAEDPELSESYREAHDLLWRAPCDLRAATRALVRYQQLIADRGQSR